MYKFFNLVADSHIYIKNPQFHGPSPYFHIHLEASVDHLSLQRYIITNTPQNYVFKKQNNWQYVTCGSQAVVLSMECNNKLIVTPNISPHKKSNVCHFALRHFPVINGHIYAHFAPSNINN